MSNWKLGEHHRKNSNRNMLEGLPSIATFLGKGIGTTRRWIRDEGLPATKLPNGRWLTHKALILQWIYAGHQAILKNNIATCLESDQLELLAEKMHVSLEDVERMRDEQRAD